MIAEHGFCIFLYGVDLGGGRIFLINNFVKSILLLFLNLPLFISCVIIFFLLGSFLLAFNVIGLRFFLSLNFLGKFTLMLSNFFIDISLLFPKVPFNFVKFVICFFLSLFYSFLTFSDLLISFKFSLLNPLIRLFLSFTYICLLLLGICFFL